MKLTDSEIISSFTTCTRAVCCSNCRLHGKPNCITQLNEMVIDLLERQNEFIEKINATNKIKRKMARNEAKRLIAKKGGGG